MTKPRILVTSAAGHTGAACVLDLLEKGYPVRAFVRRKDDRSERLKKAGAEVFVGDLFDMRDLRRAMKGVKRAYHCAPFAENLLHGTMLFALAAEESKLEVVALMSGWNPHASHPAVVTREHWMTNNIYQWMPTVDVVYVNPGLFAFTYLVGLPTAKHFGMLALPFGDGLNAPPSNEDIGRVAAGILVDPAPHIGKCYRPTGPKLISSEDVASILSGVLDRKVKYKSVPMGMFVRAALTQGLTPFEVANMRYYAEEVQKGTYAVGAPTDHVERITGRAPEDFKTIARRYVNDPAKIYSGMELGSKIGAFAFLVRMMLRRTPDLDRWQRERGYPMLKEPLLAHESKEWRSTAERKQLALLGA